MGESIDREHDIVRSGPAHEPPRRIGRARLSIALTVATVAALLATSAWAAVNLNLSKSNVNRLLPSGRFVTASTDIPDREPHTVYTTPDSSDFVLTEVCAGPGGILLQVAGVSLVQVGSGLCHGFDPWMFLGHGQAVTCSALAPEADAFCMIAGLLGRPAPTPSATPIPPTR
jgi:hypothetical protein